MHIWCYNWYTYCFIYIFVWSSTSRILLNPKYRQIKNDLHNDTKQNGNLVSGKVTKQYYVTYLYIVFHTTLVFKNGLKKKALLSNMCMNSFRLDLYMCIKKINKRRFYAYFDTALKKVYPNDEFPNFIILYITAIEKKIYFQKINVLSL